VSGPRTTADDEESAREALHVALGGHLAAQQLAAQSLAYFYASAVPSTVLWMHCWHPLPEIVTWLAALVWAMCAVLAVLLATVAGKRRAEAGRALPRANRVARAHFATSEVLPPASTLLFGLSSISSSVLWVHGLAPHLLRPDVILITSRAWLVLVAATIANRYIERH